MLLKKIILLVVGFTMIGSGVGILRIIDLGIDPFGAMLLGVSDFVNLSFGTLMMISQMLFLALTIWKRKDLVGVGSVIAMFGIGYLIDFSYEMLSRFIQVDFPFLLSLVILALTLIVMSFGVSLIIVANLGLVPYDGLGFVIEDISKGTFKFKWNRMATDGFAALVAFFLGAPVGIATFMTVFMLGPFVNFFKGVVSKAMGLNI